MVETQKKSQEVKRFEQITNEIETINRRLESGAISKGVNVDAAKARLARLKEQLQDAPPPPIPQGEKVRDLFLTAAQAQLTGRSQTKNIKQQKRALAELQEQTGISVTVPVKERVGEVGATARERARKQALRQAIAGRPSAETLVSKESSRDFERRFSEAVERKVELSAQEKGRALLARDDTFFTVSTFPGRAGVTVRKKETVRQAPFIEQPKGLAGFEQQLRRRQRALTEQREATTDFTQRGKLALQGAGVGLAESFVGTALGVKAVGELGKGLLTDTKQTVSEVVEAVRGINSDKLVGQVRKGTDIIQTQPGRTLGFVGGEVLQAFVGGQVFKGARFLRQSVLSPEPSDFRIARLTTRTEPDTVFDFKVKRTGSLEASGPDPNKLIDIPQASLRQQPTIIEFKELAGQQPGARARVVETRITLEPDGTQFQRKRVVGTSEEFFEFTKPGQPTVFQRRRGGKVVAQDVLDVAPSPTEVRIFEERLQVTRKQDADFAQEIIGQDIGERRGGRVAFTLGEQGFEGTFLETRTARKVAQAQPVQRLDLEAVVFQVPEQPARVGLTRRGVDISPGRIVLGDQVVTEFKPREELISLTPSIKPNEVIGFSLVKRPTPQAKITIQETFKAQASPLQQGLVVGDFPTLRVPRLGKRGQISVGRTDELLQKPSRVSRLEPELKPTQTIRFTRFDTPSAPLRFGPLGGVAGLSFIDSRLDLEKDSLIFRRKKDQEARNVLFENESIVSQFPAEDVITAPNIISRIDTGSRGDTSIDVALKQTQSFESKLSPSSDVALDTLADFGLDNKFDEPPPRRGKFDLDLDFTPKREKQAYDALVKQGKSFVKVNNKPLTRKGALQTAAQFVDQTTAASFKIRKTKGKPQQSGLLGGFVLGGKFRPSKSAKRRAQNIFVEKNQFRIDTPGEIQGITVKGLQALENKRRMERNFYRVGKL